MSGWAESERPTRMELDILRSFGWAVIELESVLFERYSQLSSIHSVITPEAFHKALLTMESKGFLSSHYLHGKRAFKRLVVDRRVLEKVAPKNPNEELRLALASRRVKKEDLLVEHGTIGASEAESPPEIGPSSIDEEHEMICRVNRELLSQSELTSELIQEKLETILRKKFQTSKNSRSLLALHVSYMTSLLRKSEHLFFEYIKSTVPELEESMRRILEDRGSDYLLLSFRLADSKVRKYI